MDAALATGRATLACALAVEERAARHGGARVVRVGMGVSRALPAGPVVSFGLAGSLVPQIAPGTVLSATRVVAGDGTVLWEGDALSVPGATAAVLCSSGRIVDGRTERAELARRTGAVAVDMESGALAATGRLAGVVRAVSDSPGQPIGRLARAAKPDGSTAWRAVLVALLTEPRRALRTARGTRKALTSLERAAASLAASGVA